MISFRQYIGEAAEEPKEVKQVFSIGIASVIQQLDAKAHEVADKVDTAVEITNSAIDESGKFTRAGEHIVTVQVKDKDSDGLDPKKALAILQAYIGRFLGPDEAKKIKEESLNPILSAPEGGDASGGGGTAGDSSEQPDAGDGDEEDELDESLRVLEADEDEDQDDAGEDGDGDEGDEDDDQDDGDEDDNGDGGDDDDEDDEAGEDGDDGDEGDEEGKDFPLGYYVGYQLNIKGAKDGKLDDAVKKVMSFSGVLKDLLGGMGAASFDWRSGSTGEVKTLKDLAKGLDSVFGKLDADEVTAAVEENLRNKFHSDSRYDVSDVSYWDKEIILRYCKSMLNGSDKKKISKADLSICIKILKNAKTAPSEKDVSGWTDAEKVFKPSIIAQVVNDSIRGFFKKATRGVSEKDIVLIKNYDDNIKPSADDKKMKDYEGFDDDGGANAEGDDVETDLDENSVLNELMSRLFEDEPKNEEPKNEEPKNEEPKKDETSGSGNEENDEETDEESDDEDDGNPPDDKYKQHLVSVLKSDKQFIKKVSDVKKDFGKGEKIKDDIKLDEKTVFKANTDYTNDAVVKILEAAVKANKIEKYVNDYLTAGIVKKMFGAMNVSDDDVKKSAVDRDYEQYLMFIVPMPGMKDKKEKKEAS